MGSAPPSTPPEALTALAAAVSALFIEIARDVVTPAVRKAVRDEVPEIVRRARLAPTMSRAEAADYAGWSVSKLDGYRRRGLVEWQKVGRTVRIPTDPFLRLLESGRVDGARATG